MPWSSPLFEEPAHEPRLEQLRGRAARIRRRDGRVGIVYFTVDIVRPRPEGHLWWRRWSAPFHLIQGDVWGDAEVTSMFDPRGRPGEEYQTDFQTWGDDALQLLDEVDRGVLTWLDEEWRLEWLEDDETSAFLEEHCYALDD